MSGSIWASVIVLTTFLALVVRGFARQRVPAKQALIMAGTWLAIIVGLAMLLSQFHL